MVAGGRSYALRAVESDLERLIEMWGEAARA